MRLIDFEKRYESRALCAKALGVSYQHFNNLLANETDVIQLFNGKWMTLTKYNKFFDTD